MWPNSAEPIVAPDFVVDACLEGNEQWPRMFAGYIIHGGRLALDQLLDGELDFATLQLGGLDEAQREVMYERAIEEHAKHKIPTRYPKHPVHEDALLLGTVTHGMMDGLYRRGQRGILNTIETTAEFAGVVTDELLNKLGHANERDFQRSVCEAFLTEPQYKAQAECLQQVWHAADDSLSGAPALRLSAKLRQAQVTAPKDLPEAEQRLFRGKAVWRTQLALFALIGQAIEPLRSHAIDTFGPIYGCDVIDAFPALTVYEVLMRLSSRYLLTMSAV